MINGVRGRASSVSSLSLFLRSVVLSPSEYIRRRYKKESGRLATCGWISTTRYTRIESFLVCAITHGLSSDRKEEKKKKGEDRGGWCFCEDKKNEKEKEKKQAKNKKQERKKEKRTKELE